MKMARPSRARLAMWRDRWAPWYVVRIRLDIGVVPYSTGDVVGYHLWVNGSYEDAERAAVTRLVQDGNVVVDAGANLGIYTLLASRRCGMGGVVHSFEASPIEHRKLVRTVRWNGLQNVVLNNVALSDRNGTAVIHESLDGTGALNRLDGPAKASGRYQARQVPRVSLDSYLAARDVKRVDFIKADVEGHELSVLQGAECALTENRPVVMAEMNDARQSLDSSPARVWAFLERLGYQWYRTDGPHGGLRRISQPAVFGYVNLFAIHTERLGTLDAGLLDSHG
jgi:FkbM family methyltransferase